MLSHPLKWNLTGGSLKIVWHQTFLSFHFGARLVEGSVQVRGCLKDERILTTRLMYR